MLYAVAGTVLVASTVVTVMFRHDMGEARARLAAQPTEIFTSSYGDIQYRVTGDGPPVLVVHGITGGIDQAEAIVTQWRNLRPDYRFIYVSRFGYLQSAMPHDATVRMQAAAYRELLDNLGIDRVFVVGNSAGGPSAMWFAIDFPERINGLILISSAVPGPVPGPIPPLVAGHDFIYWAAVKAAPERLLGMLMPKSVIESMSAEQKAFAIEHAFVDSLPISERTDGILFDNDVTNPGVNDVPFERVTTPTLIFQAVDDPREHAGGLELARRIPNSQFIGLTGGHLLTGHATHIRTTNAEFIARHMSR
ncbi:alpha/beta hydrolase [Nocardioides sp.]|uniref:alpha/beta fold hydrolase n=1 Tax=Nocardioides sp. TaxID=35761 RepID=UPI00262225EA|nr:alpha/beta hydrolase [Nocardioides sp.]MDI6909241.1 alpha/beta hydrolase [Nocardioides sp.]